MRAWLIHIKQDVLYTSFWFVPSLMAIGSLILYYITTNLDKAEAKKDLTFGWIFTGGPAEASTILSALAGAEITVAGVTFSLLIAILTLASSQFGPRLVRNFMRNRLNKIALGIFSATFIYCLLVLRTIRGEQDNYYVPYLAVSVGIGLGLISLGVLILFIHHVCKAMQVAYIISNITSDLKISVEQLYPEMFGFEQPTNVKPAEITIDFDGEACNVKARKTGYIQVIDTDTILAIAAKYDLVIRMECRPGDFIMPGSCLLKAWPSSRLNAKESNRLAFSFICGSQRTATQDVESNINQLVEVAIRALSPAINDPFTAMMCLDRLGEILCQLAARKFPSLQRYDKSGKLRVITKANDFHDYVSAAFNQIRQYGSGSVSVTLRLLEIIATVATFVSDEQSRDSLRKQAMMVERTSKKTIIEELDRHKIEQGYLETMAVLEKLP